MLILVVNELLIIVCTHVVFLSLPVSLRDVEKQRQAEERDVDNKDDDGGWKKGGVARAFWTKGGAAPSGRGSAI